VSVVNNNCRFPWKRRENDGTFIINY